MGTPQDPPHALGAMLREAADAVEDHALEQLRARFGDDWEIERSEGGLTARHRHETYDAKREMWVVKTRVEARSPEELHVDLCIQQAVRGEGPAL